MNNETKKTIQKIHELEDGFCNPMKLKMAQELREDLRESLQDKGWTNQEIKEMTDL